MNGDEVEDREDDGERDEGKKGKGEEAGRKKAEQERCDGRRNEVTRRAGEPDEHRIATGIFQVKWVKLDRTAPSEAEQKEHQRPDRVQVRPGVQGQPSLKPWRRITQAVCGPGMGELMDRNRGDQRGKRGEEGKRRGKKRLNHRSGNPRQRFRSPAVAPTKRRDGLTTRLAIALAKRAATCSHREKR